MKVSVLIDSYNSETYISDAILSVSSQSRLVDQIVISDASTDASAEIIRKHCAEDSRMIPVFSENRGQLSTILAGLHAAKGEIVFFLDGDDCYQENHIERMMHWWERYPHADVIYCRHKIVGEQSIVNQLRDKQDHENARWMGPIDLEKPYDWAWSTALAWALPSYHAGGVNSCLSFRRSHLEKLPLRALCDAFNDEIKANADYIILLASALYGGRKVYVPDRTVNYRVHSTSLTGQYAMGEPESAYRQRYYCALARNWLCADRRFGPALGDILDKELAAVPNPSRGHRKLYAMAKKAIR